MNTVFKTRAALVVSIILFQLIITGCTPKLVGLRADPSFTWANLKTGKLIIGGTTALISGFTDSDSNRYSELLKTQIIEHFSQLDVAPVGVAILQVGEDNYKKLLKEYQTTGEVGNSWLSQLKNKIIGKRYIAFARIDSDILDKSRNEVTGTSGLSSNSSTTQTSVTSEVARTVSVKIDIYDLGTGMSVWSGSHSEKKSKNNVYKKESGLISLIKVVTNNDSEDQKYPYPQAPELSDVLKDAFRVIAKNLPEQD